MRAFIKDVADATDEVIEKKYLVTDASIENIQIMSVLEGAHHPFLFKSLLDPISQRWAQVKGSPNLRGYFWSKRRARVLGEFIPAPQEHIIAFIRGWFTGRLLGLIEVPRNRQVGDNETFKIAQPCHQFAWLQ